MEDNLDMLKVADMLRNGEDARPLFVDAGLLKADNHPEDWYGSLEHQKDLLTRLGLDPDNLDKEGKAITEAEYKILVDAQVDLIDANDEPLFSGDVPVLAAITGKN